MRLTQFEIDSIKQAFQESFNSGQIYLFGSRVDDSLKGGDIDLYIETDTLTDMIERKLNFLVLLKQKIGDQKIDLIISKDKTRMIEIEALKNGIKL